MDLLTEEEQFELQLNFQAELEALNEMESMECNNAYKERSKVWEAHQGPASSQTAESIFEEQSESIISGGTKRSMSMTADDILDIEFQTTAKKRCLEPPIIPDKEVLVNKTASQTVVPSTFRFAHDQLPLTNSEGQRIYFNVLEEDDETNAVVSYSEKTSSLLPIPIDILKSQYYTMEEEKQMQPSRVIASNGVTEEISESNLWVEKYRPQSYMDLLSEEGINRTLLQWLKLWDKVVFGKERKTRIKSKDPKKQIKFQKAAELIEELDEHGRPYHKVAFLCGPPGLGKTTLAIIIARHVGYNVVELNASDDRNPEAFRLNLESATQMKSVLHQDHRPNCLVLDEIDGAPAASIQVLLSFIKSVGTAKGKRKKGDLPILMRPVICICNDQYSAALKPLRQLALVLNFPPTASERLTSRLNEVSLKEGLKVETEALTVLCEKTSNDIRSCLSTLQFIHREKKYLKARDLAGMTIGQKDMQKSLFAVWQEIFQFVGKKSFPKVLKTIQAFGDYERVFVGMFENYVNVKFKDRDLETLWKGPEWLCFADILQQQIAHSQLYFLMPYLPYPTVAFHMLYSTNAYPHISYPTAFYEHRAKLSQLSSTLSSMGKEMATSLKTFLDPSTLVTDIFPFLVEILKPSLRPVNTHLYSEREKQELQRVLELMISFNLNYRQERSQEGTYSYVLDPNLEEIVQFKGMKPKKVLTYAAKQLIAREVDVERIRKGDVTDTTKNSNAVQKKTTENVPKPKIAEKEEPPVEKPTLDFFGRRIPESEKNKAKGKAAKKFKVWFKFKEGYSNAVRKTIYIKDLM